MTSEGLDQLFLTGDRFAWWEVTYIAGSRLSSFRPSWRKFCCGWVYNLCTPTLGTRRQFTAGFCSVAKLLAITISRLLLCVTKLESRTFSSTTNEKWAAFDYAVKTAHEEVRKLTAVLYFSTSDPDARGNRFGARFFLPAGRGTPGSFLSNTPPDSHRLPMIRPSRLLHLAKITLPAILQTVWSRTVENGRTKESINWKKSEFKGGDSVIIYFKF